MLVALDEGPGPPIKYQYAELGKLYTVVSQLVRCCDVSLRMQSSINGLYSIWHKGAELNKEMNNSVFLLWIQTSDQMDETMHSCEWPVFQNKIDSDLYFLQEILHSLTHTATPTSQHQWCLCSNWWQRSCLWGPAMWRRSLRTAATLRRRWSCFASAAGRTLSSPPPCSVNYSGR